MKLEKKWIALAVAAVPVLWMALPTLLPSEPPASLSPDPVQPATQTPPPPETRTAIINQPAARTGISLELDSMARTVVNKSWNIKQAALGAQLATEQAKSREAGARGTTTGQMEPVLPELGNSNLPSSSSVDPHDDFPLSRLQLAGLITAASGKTFAYLSYDNSASVRVHENGLIAGIKISNITPDGITASLGKHTRRLTMEGQ